MMSASPRWMVRIASMIAPEPEAQAVTTVFDGPVRPKRMATWPLAMLAITLGMKNGLSRMAPRSTRTIDCCSQLHRPPMPLPIEVPACSPATSASVRPASAIASSLPIRASCTKRSRRRASLRSM
jgi:hypothetical protein